MSDFVPRTPGASDRAAANSRPDWLWEYGDDPTAEDTTWPASEVPDDRPDELSASPPASFRFASDSRERDSSPARTPVAEDEATVTAAIASLPDVVQRYWGFQGLRPFQEQAMESVLRGQDSLVVLPTGGGKSLCYQAPAVVRGDTTVVISPLISLMKDQVDQLRAVGVPAFALHSGLSSEEAQEVEYLALRGELRLLFVSPERMSTSGFRRLVNHLHVRRFAVDEAHCISHWGHDFRPEYRQLRELKNLFPQASIHAFTATATQQVRHDICEQLGLRDPRVFIGNFDRPNLTYRIVPRDNHVAQVLQFLREHNAESGIIYCIRRKEVDELTGILLSRGIKAVAYHAGLTPEERHRAQEEFAQERCDVVVATVAFGMGIDRSNVRFVLHTGLPKSLEAYQQETGRAGRDGLEAECVLLYSGGDARMWRSIVEKSAQEAEVPVGPEFLTHALSHIADMERYCLTHRCRHKQLVQYFGQEYPSENCGACDICLSLADEVSDSQTIAKKILSCVYRVQERFGAEHVIHVLRGANVAAIREQGHEKLSTYGLLKGHSAVEVRSWIHQLISQDVLVRDSGQYPTLRLNAASWDVMKDLRTIKLLQVVKKDAAANGDESSTDASTSKRESRSKTSVDSWEGVDKELFEELRLWRVELAREKGLPPYVVCHDSTLRDLAKIRPASLPNLRYVYGIGERKLKEWGERVLQLLDEKCKPRHLSRNVGIVDLSGTPLVAAPVTDPAPTAPRTPRAAHVSTATDPRISNSRNPSSRNLDVDDKTSTPAGIKGQAWALFEEGASLDNVMRDTGRARATVVEYLCDFIQHHRLPDLRNWVTDVDYDRIIQVTRQVGRERLKPIFLALQEQVPYDIIRLVLAHDAAVNSESTAS